MPWPTIATWADVGVALGTGALAVATFKTARLTRQLVEENQQPILVPVTDVSVPGTGPRILGGTRFVSAAYSWKDGGPSGWSHFWLPVKNVGTGVALLTYRGAAELIDPYDSLTLSDPGSVVIAPGEPELLEFKGSKMPVPPCRITLTYSTPGSSLGNQTEVLYEPRGTNVNQEIELVAGNPVIKLRIRKAKASQRAT